MVVYRNPRKGQPGGVLGAEVILRLHPGRLSAKLRNIKTRRENSHD
jgi:hypothetical protein